MENSKLIMPEKVCNLLQLPLWIFGISFTIGTALLLFHFVDEKNEYLFIIGLFYVLIAVVLNSLAMLILVIYSFVYRQYQQEILLNTSVILINIPVAIFYCYLVFNV